MAAALFCSFCTCLCYILPHTSDLSGLCPTFPQWRHLCARKCSSLTLTESTIISDGIDAHWSRFSPAKTRYYLPCLCMSTTLLVFLPFLMYAYYGSQYKSMSFGKASPYLSWYDSATFLRSIPFPCPLITYTLYLNWSGPFQSLQ